MTTMLPWYIWVFPVAFIIHNIEEALYFPAWSKKAGKFHKPVGTFEFVFALIVITFLAIIIALFFYFMGVQSFACYLYFAFNFIMFINVFVPHLAATIAMKKYCPGLLTGSLLLIPVTVLNLYNGYYDNYFTFPIFWYVTIPFAAILIGSIPVLFKTGLILKRIFQITD